MVGMLAEGLQGRDVPIEVINRWPQVVEERLVRLGIPVQNIQKVGDDDCIAKWTTAEVERLAADAVTKIKNDAALTGEVLMFADGQRVDRFRSFELPDKPSEPLVLHVNPVNLQLVKPVMYRRMTPSDVRAAGRSQASTTLSTAARSTRPSRSRPTRR